MLEIKNGIIGGYGVAFTSPKERDLAGDYFTADTNLWLDQYPVVPLLYNHGQDSYLGGRVIGTARPVRKDSRGVWYEAQLAERDDYERAIADLVRAGKLGYSTGSLPHLVQRAQDGRLESWPVAELTLTPTPAAGPYLTTVQAVRSHYKSVSLPVSIRGGIEMNLIETIKTLVPGLSDEQYTQLNAVLSLVGMADSEADAEMPEVLAETLKSWNREVGPAMVKAMIAAARVAAVGAPPAPRIPANGPVVTMTEAEVKSLVDKALLPYITPYSAASPASVPPVAKDEAVKSFQIYLHTGNRARRNAMKALEEGTPAEGGYTVPEQFYAELVRGLSETSLIRAAGARIVQMTTNTMEVPTMTYSAAAVLTDEEGDYDAHDPGFGHVTFTPYKATRVVPVSEELAADSAFDIWGGILAPDFEQAFSAFENSYFTTGTGTDQPQGVVTGAGLGVTAADDTTLDPDEIIDLYHSLGYLYRQNAVWMMNDATIKYLRKFTDGTGQYLWQPGMAAGQPDRILGRPVITNNSMATIAASAKVILFGDFSYYWIGQRSTMTVDRNPYLYMNKGQVAFFARMRVDGHVMLADAFKVLAMHA